MATPTHPTGQQWTITYGEQSATVVQVGGGLREYRVGQRPVLFGYPPERKADAGRGQLLMPWPNRTRDGKYSFEGVHQQLALSEPARANATHGLVRWSSWSVQEQTANRLTVGTVLYPQQGWDYPLELSVQYALGPDGLSVTPRATALGPGAAPFGFGAHPYLTTGEERVDELTLSLPARTVLTVDDRLIPTGRQPAQGELDFSTARPIGATAVDHAFTDLTARQGRWEVSVSAAGRTSTLWAQADAFPYVQVFTGDSLPPQTARTTGVAVEPMTCPANALASGRDLIVLAQGESWSGTWGVSYS